MPDIATPPSVLVVEDEALVLFELCLALEDAGYRVHAQALTVAEGLEALHEGRPSIALLDINVGAQMVWPLARALRDEEVPLLFLSANLDHPELRDEFADAHRLEKPAAARAVIEKLASVLA